jgi:putative ABC transport system substrate-binding protein
MKRRALFVLLGSVSATLTHAAGAQTQDGPRRLGILIPYSESDRETRSHLATFKEELARLGWTDGRNLRIDIRWTGGDANRIPMLARELVASGPDVILARSTLATAALLRETRTIPIIFVIVSDPIGDGFVSSMARPGGNATGFTNVEASLAGKWLQLLKEIDPRMTRVAVLYGPKTSAGNGSYYLRLVEEAAASMSVKVIAAPVEDVGEAERRLETFAKEPNGALLVTPDATTTLLRSTILAAAGHRNLPAVYAFRDFTAEGGLASYGIDVADEYRRAAKYVDRILRGAQANDLPVQAPTKFELVVNMKTAKALGLTIPASILARADEVIE